MRKTMTIVIGCLLAASLAPARADAPPKKPWFGSGEGRRLSDLTLDLGCPAENTAAKRAQIQQTLATVSAATDPKVRTAFVTWVTASQTWFEGYASGIAGVGTWAELDARLKTASAALAALPVKHPTVPSPSQVMAAADQYAAAGALADSTRTIADAIADSPCRAHASEWNQVAYELKVAKEHLGSALGTVIATHETAIDQWTSGRPSLPATPPTTYFEHADWVTKQLQYLAASQKMAAVAADLDKYAAITPKAAELATKIRAQLATVQGDSTALVAELRQVQMPPMAADPARGKLVKAAVEGIQRTMLGTPRGAKGSSTEKWTENVEVRRTEDRIWYRPTKFEREFYTMYYAWHPTGDQVTAPDLPGMPTADICELWSQNFTRYKKGDPSKKAWFPSQDGLVTYLPCANVGVTSSLRLK